MPFEPGIGSKIYKNVGRKGYEIEQKQLDKMKKIVNKDLKLVERLLASEEINGVDMEKLSALQQRVLKYLDKLHASKEKHEVNIEQTIEIDQKTKEIAEEFEKKLKETL